MLFKKSKVIITVISLAFIIFIGFITLFNGRASTPDLSFLNSNNALTLLAQQETNIMILEGVEYSIPSKGEFLNKFQGEQWKHVKYKRQLELSPDMIIKINEDLSLNFYSSESLAMITSKEGYRYYNIPKEVFEELQSHVKPPNSKVSTEAKAIVDHYLAIILSSPKSSSNSNDYIEAHRDTYETIVKLGDPALNYMLSLFEGGELDSLKSNVMMKLCRDILGAKDPTSSEINYNPRKWYETYTSAKKGMFNDSEMPYPSIPSTATSLKEQLVYKVALEHYRKGNDLGTLTFVAPRIYGTHEEGDTLKIFTTIYTQHYSILGNMVLEQGGSIIPCSIVFQKNKDGISYVLKEFIEASDGSYYGPSIKKFCKPRGDIADKMISGSSDNRDFDELMIKNLIEYLNQNNFKGVSLKKGTEKIVPIN